MMIHIGLVFTLLGILWGAGAAQEPSPPTKLWALLVAGSDGWYNYRHQADVCHAYHILNAHGIPDENIVVMMKDDIANNTENPTPGIIINHPNGTDVYHAVPKDYVGTDVTPENFINILTGNKAAMEGIGSGKVIESGPNDHVFVNFVDHGATGIVAFPVGELTAKQLNDALNKMYHGKRYKKMVLYIEACESGSMFNKILPKDINILATTAANAQESSYACYYDEERQTYLGDWYSVNWMEDSDKENIEQETLQQQFKIVKHITNTSHVMEYGDVSIGKTTVGEFQGEQEAPRKTVPSVPYDPGSPSWEVPLNILYKKLEKATTEKAKQLIQDQIQTLIENRSHVDTIIRKIVTRVSGSQEHFERLANTRPTHLSQLDCHHQLVKGFSRHCFDFGMNTYAMKYAVVLANICEEGLDPDDALRTIRQVCKSVTIKEGII